MPAIPQLAQLLLLLCLVGPPGAAAVSDVEAGEGQADSAAAPELPDAPAAEAGPEPPKPPPKRKPVLSVAAAAANVGLPRNMTKETMAQIPDCSAFDACCIAGENSEGCCKEHLGNTLRSCGICTRAACSRRVDSCSQTDSDAQVDKYCDICFQIGGGFGAAKAQASPRRMQEKQTQMPTPSRYDRYDRDRFDRDNYDLDRYDRHDRHDRDRYDRDLYDRYDKDRRYDRDRYYRDRYDRDRYDLDRDAYDHLDDRDLERYKRRRKDRLMDEYEPKSKSKSKKRPKPETYDPRRQDL